MKSREKAFHHSGIGDMATLIQDVFLKQKNSSYQHDIWSAGQRIERLNRLEKWILSHRNDISEAIYNDFKKPLSEVESQEIFVILSEIRHVRKQLKKWLKPLPAGRTLPLLMTRSWTEFFPKGVVLIISPWNFPFLLSIGPLISSIAAGNRSMLKPSEISHHTSVLIRTMVKELFPEDEVSVICGKVEVATELLKHPFDHIFFTGSTEVGKIVMKAAAENMSSVTMELGGKSPAIVDETADLADAAKKIIWGKFMNAGQTCVAPDYVLVKDEVYQEFINLLKNTVTHYFGKNESDREISPDFARVIDQRHYQRLQELLDDALEAGAVAETGTPFDRDPPYIPPTILTGVPDSTKILHEEIFGPILPVLQYRSLNGALETINRNGEPLAVYVFSKKRKRVRQIFQRTRSGSGGINEVVIQFIHPYLPFGGIGKSGFGKAHGFAGFQSFSNERAFIKGNRWSFLKLVYPPYTRWKRKIIDILIRYF